MPECGFDHNKIYCEWLRNATLEIGHWLLIDRHNDDQKLWKVTNKLAATHKWGITKFAQPPHCGPQLSPLIKWNGWLCVKRMQLRLFELYLSINAHPFAATIIYTRCTKSTAASDRSWLWFVTDSKWPVISATAQHRVSQVISPSDQATITASRWVRRDKTNNHRQIRSVLAFAEVQNILSADIFYARLCTEENRSKVLQDSSVAATMETTIWLLLAIGALVAYVFVLGLFEIYYFITLGLTAFAARFLKKRTHILDMTTVKRKSMWRAT